MIDTNNKAQYNGNICEQEVYDKLINFKNDSTAKAWLKIMGYNPYNIKEIKVKLLEYVKSDLLIEIKNNNAETFYENIQVKHVQNRLGFNQVDCRYLKDYDEIWNFPEEILNLLKYYVGENIPYTKNSRYVFRMYIDEFRYDKRINLINWFEENKNIIIEDILKGNKDFQVNWFIVKRNGKWIICNIKQVIDHYSKGKTQVTIKGNLKIGKVTMQRRGGNTNNKINAIKLQFKIDPSELFNI